MYSYTSSTIRRVRELISNARARKTERVFVLEGKSFVADAVASGVAIESFVVTPEQHEFVDGFGLSVPVYDVAPETMERLSDTRTPPGVLAVVRQPETSFAQLQTASTIMICIDLSDPGNAGTIVRSAVAAGLDAVIFAGNSVDVWNPKVVRASVGAMLRIPVVTDASINGVFSWCRDSGITTVGAEGTAKQELWGYEFPERVAIVIGNEAHGLGSAAEMCDELVSIPIADGVESLNAAMAATVIGFEYSRRHLSS